MNRIAIAFSIIALLLLSEAKSACIFLSGKPTAVNEIKDGIQYIAKGGQYLNLNEAPVVVEFNNEDNSIRVFCPELASPDSLFFHFIPGDLFTVRLSTEVSWNDVGEIYSYQYTLFSDNSSKSKIWHFEVEAFNDYKETRKPEKWHGSYAYSRGVFGWTAFQDNRLSPGETVAGFGFESFAPPSLVLFEVWGKDIIISKKGYDETFGEAVSHISSEHRGISGYTLVPGVCPESLEPVEWLERIFFRLPKLTTCGYFEESIEMEITPILAQLMETFGLKENHSAVKLEQEINNALAALEPYQDQMEPEAWAFITENLKYVLRHTDIVRFKEYP